jgi:DNA-binding LytR/AlgR family response regulator
VAIRIQIGNAIKFTVSGSITITADRINDYIHITISDTGIGIPVDKRQTIANDNKLTFDKVIAFDGEEYNVIATDDILYIEVDKKDTIIFTKQGNYKTRKSLALWKNSLRNQSFFQCHRSFIVNLKHIVKISPMFNNNYIMKLQGTSVEIPISKNHIMELKKILNL